MTLIMRDWIGCCKVLEMLWREGSTEERDFSFKWNQIHKGGKSSGMTEYSFQRNVCKKDKRKGKGIHSSKRKHDRWIDKRSPSTFPSQCSPNWSRAMEEFFRHISHHARKEILFEADNLMDNCGASYCAYLEEGWSKSGTDCYFYWAFYLYWLFTHLLMKCLILMGAMSQRRSCLC